MVLAMILILVSVSVVRGADVTLCTRKPNAEFKAGFLSAAFFSWFSPVIDVGQTKQLGLDDLPVQVRYFTCIMGFHTNYLPFFWWRWWFCSVEQA